MTAYAVGHLTSVDVGPDIVEYLERIDETLTPFQGTFIIHGDKPQVLEGTWKGDLIVIAFPDMDHARSWYSSPAYQAILPLRTRNAVSTVFLVEGVDPSHLATDVIAGLPQDRTPQPNR